MPFFFGAGFAAGFAAGLAAGFAAGLAAGLAAGFAAGLAAGFAAGLAAGLAAGFLVSAFLGVSFLGGTVSPPLRWGPPGAPEDPKIRLTALKDFPESSPSSF
ncbi:hypothetical protein DYH09_14025 [bacterium CPR1]|nr:hypothetical protein [bacterium CPR1]